MTESFEGKPAKTTSAIRDALTALRPPKQSNHNPDKGPLIDGFQPDHPITAATFHDPEMAKKFQACLSSNNVFSKLITRFDSTAIVVDAEDSQQAAQIFKQTRSEFPNIKPKRLSRRFDFMIFGFAIGASMGMMLVAGAAKNKPVVALVCLLLCTIGVLGGHLGDRLRNHKAIHGKIRFGVAEFLILTTIPVLTLLAFELVPKVLKI